MKNPLLKKILPHLIAIVLFLIVSILFCKPALEGNVLNQGDIISWKGMVQNAFEYKASHGHYPLWNPNLFSGMPNYQTVMQGKSILPDTVKLFSFGLPKPINFFFIACLCFYVLALCLRVKPVIGMFGALAFAFATYNPIIIGVGHESKMWAIAFMPLVIAGLISTFEKRYWLGLALTTYGIYQQIGVNHLQITYYTFLIALAIALSYLVNWVKNKEWKHMGITAGISALAILIGLAGSALVLKTTAEYVPYTMRGGKDIEVKGDTVTAVKTKGLDTDYAFEYSLGKAEVVTVMMPDAFGSNSGEVLRENSKVVSKLVDKGVPEANAIQLAGQLPRYWGGIDGAAGTAGPPYLGAIVCILTLLGFVLYKKPLRWGLLAISILSVLMAYGKHLAGFNHFLFNTLPLYNKFRAPTMALVITEFTFPVMAILSLQYILFREKSRELLKADFKKILIACGVLIGVLLLMWFGMDYSAPIDKVILGYKFDDSGNNDINRLIISGMKADRKAMFGGQLLRSIGFILLVLGLLYLYMRNTVKPIIVILVLLVATCADLLIVGKKYLDENHYVPKEEMESTNFQPTQQDLEILKDKDPDYRVFSLRGNPYTESRTSYFHKSIGGYHPAKLRIYQDIIDRYLSSPFNEQVLDMLNTKYVITRTDSVITRPTALGPCWLVKYVKITDDRVTSMKTLGSTSLKDTAIVEKSFGKMVVQPVWDSAAYIRLTSFDPDTIRYESNGNGPQFAVFSEIYYPVGWNAYIDGKKTDYCNVNYVLRGISLPAGKHEVKFLFEPPSVKKGKSIMFMASILVLLIFLGGLFLAWRQGRKIA